MAKKRKVARPAGPAGPKDLDPADARLKGVTTFADIADEQEQYFLDQDKILLEDEPRSKRLRRSEAEDEFLEASDEEILGEDDSADEDVVDDGAGGAPTSGADDVYSDEEDAEQEKEGDQGWWGSSRQEYYNADNIETEADALEEEAEARRLQQKKLSKMSEADFIFDEDEWAGQIDESKTGEEPVTETLKDVEITDEIGPEERYRLLQARYPEFDHLVDEFQELQPLLLVCQKEAEGKPSRSLEVAKHWILGSYVATLASYFAILTSPARDGNGTHKLLDASELRDHEIMSTLVSCRQAWQKVKGLKPPQAAGDADGEVLSEESPEDAPDVATRTAKEMVADEDSPVRRKRKDVDKEKVARAKAIEESLADLSGLLTKTKKPSKSNAERAAVAQTEDDHSDFGEDDVLDAHSAADKASKKKTLRFYTSQIVQKSNRRAGASRDAGGDMDIPYRERLRDRQARLQAAAEKRGKKMGADLGGSDGEEEVTNGMRDKGDEEYYDMVNAASKKKRADKEALYDALAAAGKADRVVEKEEVGPDGKRRITYEIRTNKGLTPHRKKDVRNPRVKKRKKWDEKKKKLAGLKPIWKGGEGKGGYQGELTGIKAGLIKSIKL